LHLGGFTAEDDEGNPGSELLVDTHAARIAEPAWKLHAYALRRFGPKPTMIEWDNDIPPFATIMAEAATADAVADAALTLDIHHGGGAMVRAPTAAAGPMHRGIWRGFSPLPRGLRRRRANALPMLIRRTGVAPGAHCDCGRPYAFDDGRVRGGRGRGAPGCR